MNRLTWVVALVIGLLSFSGMANKASAQPAVADEVASKLAAAEQAIGEAREAISKGKELLTLIPEDSPYLPEVTQMLKAASSNWKVAVDSMSGAVESSGKIGTATTDTLAKDYALLAKANANVALAGAKVVQIGLAYVDAVANNRTEALDLIQEAMQDALAASSQVRFNYDRIKSLISEKYSK